ncbi:preprotein translocase subunit YajC [Cytobacillus eiseniae]|uniref:Preprotein translocase subunit YajC n=1 Tax=Cytobacillus eiseniae TaxID=762947 RepID=A0ABS4RBB8_9BACI|nr:hypothetical protein [Cytobacillus eiseniae]MBP2239640.1 preprotein translocase subunit YajC [Cytobacillus eiseniae]
MWWFMIVTLGIILFAFLIDFRRKKRRNDKHTKTVNPSIKKGEGSNWNSGDGPAGF